MICVHYIETYFIRVTPLVGFFLGHVASRAFAVRDLGFRLRAREYLTARF